MWLIRVANRLRLDLLAALVLVSDWHTCSCVRTKVLVVPPTSTLTALFRQLRHILLLVWLELVHRQRGWLQQDWHHAGYLGLELRRTSSDT